MRIDILTIFPELVRHPFDYSILKRSKTKNLVEIHVHDIRQYADNKHKKVDDYAFGGEAGMVMMIQPIADCIDKLKSERAYDEIIFLTPDGDLFEQQIANDLSLKQNIILLCGHYKGIDQRIRDYYITQELSIGNYVLTGGELPAVIIADAVIRLIPGVLNNETSALTDSFQDGMLSHPVYTRPACYKGLKVPEILLSGNEKKIKQWKLEKAIAQTDKRRPNLTKE